MMKSIALAFFLFQVSCLAWGDVIPVIVAQPQSQSVSLGSNATFTVVSTNATGFQWRFDGVDVPGATNASLQITNANSLTGGYYVVIVKNAVGWAPSQMAYLTVIFPLTGPQSAIRVPFSNTGNPSAQVPFDGTAQIVAGPELDQMRPIGPSTVVSNGYFNLSASFPITTVEFDQSVYYAVYISGFYSMPYPSTVLKLSNLGSTANLKYPVIAEWPEPQIYPNPVFQPTNLVKIPGENITFSTFCAAYNEYMLPVVQWRKDGKIIPGATNATYTDTRVGDVEDGFTTTFSITNLQAADAGVYDLEIFGDNWFTSAKIQVSIQTTNGPGVFQSPRFTGTNFASDLIGVPTRNYAVQWSSNLSTWNDLVTISNTTGTVTFTNALDPSSAKFYRTKLLP